MSRDLSLLCVSVKSDQAIYIFFWGGNVFIEKIIYIYVCLYINISYDHDRMDF